MAEDMGDKTEEPTGKKLSDAKNQGNFAKSPNLSAAVDLLGGLVVIMNFGAGIAKAFHTIIVRSFEPTDVSVLAAELTPLIYIAAWEAAKALLPFLGLCFLIAAVSQIFQVGLNFSTSLLEPKWSRLDPFAGISNIFNKQNAFKTAINSVKLAIVGVIGATFIVAAAYKFASLPLIGSLQGIIAILDLAQTLAIRVLLVALVIGVFDFVYQRRIRHEKLKMTKEEVKDERRAMEGDPTVKGQRFQLYRKIVLQRVNSAVPQADVVVTNPTHFSVAIRYDQSTMKAPKVIAKGADFVAMRIREVARNNAVPIVERPPLARSLYAKVDVGREILGEHYQAVAEVLAYVYKIEESLPPSADAAQLPEPALA